MRISDWSSDVCSSDLRPEKADLATMIEALSRPETRTVKRGVIHYNNQHWTSDVLSRASDLEGEKVTVMVPVVRGFPLAVRSEEHTSELQSLMRISYAVFCLKKKINTTIRHNTPSSN